MSRCEGPEDACLCAEEGESSYADALSLKQQNASLVELEAKNRQTTLMLSRRGLLILEFIKPSQWAIDWNEVRHS
jgi:hypothetical protein